MTTTLPRWAVCALLCTQACTREAPRAARKPRVEIAVLATGEEAGGLGRAPLLLAQWQAQEGHCLDGRCATLAVSTGGHPGPAAAVLGRLGYAASVLGAAEAEALGRGDGLPPTPPHLAVALTAADGGAQTSVVVERGGVRFFVLGVSGGAAADGGVDLASAEALMQREIAPSWKVAPAALVVSDLCVKDLGDILQRNARAWPFLLAVVGRPCGPTPPPRHIDSVLLLASAVGLEGYGKATLTLDLHTAALLRAQGAYVPLGPTP